MNARRRATLVAALGFLEIERSASPALRALHAWLDSWRGLGQIATAMVRDGYELHLTSIDASTWRATFSRHPMFAADGFGADRTLWRAVQLAAWDAAGSTARQ